MVPCGIKEVREITEDDFFESHLPLLQARGPTRNLHPEPHLVIVIPGTDTPRHPPQPDVAVGLRAIGTLF